MTSLKKVKLEVLEKDIKELKQQKPQTVVNTQPSKTSR